ncbi:hypothetical protein Q4Y15_000384 [Campylobacter fetus]|uniref:Uncharacterized protein n=3 Tax=Campylobacter fetus TaxID=196 RepID=A0A5L8JTY7_CAMFE|nr:MULTISPECIES: hypothetical protein [Campylobacter]OCS23368.1 hypothetical protein CFVI97532_00910 [Campylobacter fetus subsp. venerealis cfvi97/532]OCS26342.1 hypothetical protein CFVB10_04425 [Campylobacter fetus subsp. venerealis cfvB10]OCS30734.1 hypothetical protein CFVCCUG33900_01215 [Campylobacter fetus subsp. venerealis LMG 6570 = CCUG 33900]OCS43012.1 hypothetical protein CFVI02298_01815 [Campylobacter fetus subsp. venerealis cfvi02/298]ABK82107.1 conserved hypothetical protein [Cam
MQIKFDNYSKEEIYNLAFNYENRGILIYSNFVDTEIFNQILSIKKSGLELLKNLADEKNYSINLNECEVLNPKDNFEKLIVAINYELEINEFYKNASEFMDDDVKDLFFRLWATSNNEYIPALKASLLSISCQNLAPNIQNSNQNNTDPKSNNSIKDFLEEANKIASGEANMENINTLLNHPSFPFFSGVAAGGLIGLLINEIIKKEKIDE